MPTCCAILILTLTRMITITGHILQDASQTELESVNKRLTDEKGARLLLRNDVDNLMLESKEIERELNGEIKVTFYFNFAFIMNITRRHVTYITTKYIVMSYGL